MRRASGAGSSVGKGRERWEGGIFELFPDFLRFGDSPSTGSRDDDLVGFFRYRGVWAVVVIESGVSVAAEEWLRIVMRS